MARLLPDRDGKYVKCDLGARRDEDEPSVATPSESPGSERLGRAEDTAGSWGEVEQVLEQLGWQTIDFD